MTTTILASLILDPEKALDLIENSITWYKPMPEAGGASAAEIIIALAEKSGLNPDSFIGLEEMLTATIRRIWLNQSAQEAEKAGEAVVQITGSGSKDDLIRLDREAMGK